MKLVLNQVKVEKESNKLWSLLIRVSHMQHQQQHNNGQKKPFKKKKKWPKEYENDTNE